MSRLVSDYRALVGPVDDVVGAPSPSGAEDTEGSATGAAEGLGAVAVWVVGIWVVEVWGVEVGVPVVDPVVPPVEPSCARGDVASLSGAALLTPFPASAPAR